MNTQEKSLFGSIEPEIAARIDAATASALRRNRDLAVIGSVPILLAAASAEGYARAAAVMGVDTRRVRFSTYLLVAVFATLAGVLLAVQTASGQPAAATG